jgi:hypothetical protein
MTARRRKKWRGNFATHAVRHKSPDAIQSLEAIISPPGCVHLLELWFAQCRVVCYHPHSDRQREFASAERLIAQALRHSQDMYKKRLNLLPMDRW